jgi:hypothetical protein
MDGLARDRSSVDSLESKTDRRLRELLIWLSLAPHREDVPHGTKNRDDLPCFRADQQAS